MKHTLPHDPYNLIITGVGGQGNVLASRIVGNMLSRSGFHVTIGETFGASQRGGSVMSHLRISAEGGWSPQIPRGKADMVVALEPTEALRVLMDYGNPNISVLCNMRPIHSVGVITGIQNYPSLAELEKHIRGLSASSCFINATDEAMKLGNPIFGNIMMIGALAGFDRLPLERQDFEAVLSAAMPSSKVEINLKAYDMGLQMVKAE